MPTSSACSDLQQYFVRMLDALVELRANYQYRSQQAGEFYGLSRAQFDDVLGELRARLEGQVVVSMTARAEALFQDDVNQRVKGRRKEGGVLHHFKALHQKYPERKRLADILDIWRGAGLGGTFKFQEFERLLKQRHWFAHGGYWTLKAGVMIDPFAA